MTPRRVLLLVAVTAVAAVAGIGLSSAGVGGEGPTPAPDWLRLVVAAGSVAFFAGTLIWWARTRD